jgi:predicted lactoylglutathione lyase
MHKQIFVNLPVKNLARSRTFFSSLGFEFNPQFSNDDGACMIIGENIFAMLLTEPFFRGFTTKPIADAREATEVLTCLSCESRDEVDALVAKAIAAGGRAPNPKQDHGFMYGHGFEDLDGHLWELAWMDQAALPPQA